jgi:hypothetical protein
MSLFQALLRPSYASVACQENVQRHVDAVLASIKVSEDNRGAIRYLIYIVCVNKLFATDYQLQTTPTFKQNDVIRVQMPDFHIAALLRNGNTHYVNTQEMFETKDEQQALNIILPSPFTNDCTNAVYIQYGIKKLNALPDIFEESILIDMVAKLSDPIELTHGWLESFKQIYEIEARKNNAMWQCVVFPAFGVPVMIATATRDIVEGEAVTISYGADHWVRSVLCRMKTREYIDMLNNIVY